MSEIEVFEVQCGECESLFQIDSTQAGTTVHCPHCDSPAEIPSLAEITGEGETAEQEITPRPIQKPRPPQRQQQRERPTARTAGGDQDTRESRGKVKASAARSSAKLLRKTAGILYGVACFVGVAWSVKVVGMLYPIVNYKRGSYLDWFIEATITTAWAAALIGLLIAIAELIVVILHIQENMMTSED